MKILGRCLCCGTLQILNQDGYCQSCVDKMNELKRIRYNKPPLGIEPHKIWIEQRITNLIDAMNRYIQDSRKVPIEWMEEYNKLIHEI